MGELMQGDMVFVTERISGKEVKHVAMVLTISHLVAGLVNLKVFEVMRAPYDLTSVAHRDNTPDNHEGPAWHLRTED